MLCWKLLIYPLSPLIANTLIYRIYFASQSQECKPIWDKAYPIYCYLLCVIKRLQMSICFSLTSYKETLRRTRATKEISSIISHNITTDLLISLLLVWGNQNVTLPWHFTHIPTAPTWLDPTAISTRHSIFFFFLKGLLWTQIDSISRRPPNFRIP